MLTSLSIFLIAFLISLVLTPLARTFGLRLKIVDTPGELSIHTCPIPRTGGLALFVAFVLAIGYAWTTGLGNHMDQIIIGILIGAGIITWAGFLDDIKQISPLQRLLWQLLGATIAIGLGLLIKTFPLAGIGVSLSLLYLVGGANAINLLDGMNGLAAGTTAIAAFFLAILAAWQENLQALVLALSILGTTLGFLPYNFNIIRHNPQATIFMGDSGSLFLGFTLSSIGVLLAVQPYDLVGFITPLVIILIPILDTALAILRRFTRMTDLFSGDRQHIYDLLAKKGLSNTRTVLIIYATTVILGVISLIMIYISPLPALLLASIIFTMTGFTAIRLGAIEVSRIAKAGSLKTAFSRAINRYAHHLLLDSIVVIAAYYLALILRFSGDVPGDTEKALHYANNMLDTIPFLVITYAFCNSIFGLYNRIWRHASSQDALNIIAATMTGTAVVFVSNLLWGEYHPIPMSVILVGGLIVLAAFIALRFRSRLLSGIVWRLGVATSEPQQKVLIVGAGETGQFLARRMYDQRWRYFLVGFIDDDPKKIGMGINGAKILGDRQEIVSVVGRKDVDLIVIAIHKIDKESFQEILSLCLMTKARVKFLPDTLKLLHEPLGMTSLRNVSLKDLLGRTPIPVDETTCRQVIAEKVVLVTGAAGSIGSEMCRQALRFEPKTIVALDNNETGLHDLLMEIKDERTSFLLHPVLGDVNNKERMENIFQLYKPQVIFHCAAYKHVPLLERFPDEAMKTNIGGTILLAELAMKYEAERLIYVSSDKAVYPSNILGVSKRVGELYITNMSKHAENGSTFFTTVRFGNVLGSRGSVIPTFWKQIEKGGPVTVTHPAMKRYFMGIEEAVNLIIQATAFTTGGDIFVLDMGEELYIEDLARKMIRLKGLRVGKDIQIVNSGMRPGEKLVELLTCPVYEEKQETLHPRIFRVQDRNDRDLVDINSKIQNLFQIIEKHPNEDLLQEFFYIAQRPCLDCQNLNNCGQTLPTLH